MPKLPPVTADELKANDDSASHLTMQFHDLNNRLEKQILTDGEMLSAARTFLALSLAAGRSSQLLIGQHLIAEQQREIDRLRAGQAKSSAFDVATMKNHPANAGDK